MRKAPALLHERVAVMAQHRGSRSVERTSLARGARLEYQSKRSLGMSRRGECPGVLHCGWAQLRAG